MIMNSSRLSVLFLLFSLSLAASELVNSYAYSKQLHEKYLLRWSILGDEIHVALEVDTLGWIGFGLGEPGSGSMPGSDMVTVSVADNGDVSIHDRHALEKATPIIDTCQDWTLVCAQEVDGKTIAELKRKLKTGDDDQDREIFVPTQEQRNSGTTYDTRIVFAFGTSDVFGQHEPTNRGSLAINLFPELYPASDIDPNDPDIVVEEYRMNNAAIPASTTTYMCQTFILPSEEAHIIKIEAVLSPQTAKYVHHFGVIACPGYDDWFNTRLNSPRNCYAGGRSSCSYTIWGWGPGSGPLVLPKDVGFRSGNTTGLFAVNLQMHFDNPGLDVGMIDNSGFRVTYSKRLRTHDAGALTIGDPFVSAPDIPAGLARAHYEFECSPSCTSTWPHDITVFASWMHMHMSGRQAFTTIHAANATISNTTTADDIEYFSQVDFFDFRFQQTLPLPSPRVIHQGEKLNLHCIFDTSDRTDPTPFFINSMDEMCLQILYYYPELPGIPNCGAARKDELPGTPTLSVCGFASDIINETNPTQPDPLGLDTIEFGSGDISPSECLEVDNGDNSQCPIMSSATIPAASFQFISFIAVAVLGFFYSLQNC